MKYINKKDFPQKDWFLVNKTIQVAQKSISKRGRKVGCIILCNDGTVFEGATNEHTRYLGSTCAERMAVDQLYKESQGLGIIPQKIFLTGYTDEVKNNHTLLPCGCCREMLYRVGLYYKVPDLEICCFSWDRKNLLLLKVNELFPIFTEFS